MIRARKNRPAGSGTPRNLPNGSVMKNMVLYMPRVHISHALFA